MCTLHESGESGLIVPLQSGYLNRTTLGYMFAVMYVQFYSGLAISSKPPRASTSIMNSYSEAAASDVITRMWSALDTTGLERFQLLRVKDNWSLGGTILRLHADQAIEVRYLLTCDSQWQTVNVHVEVHHDDQSTNLIITNRKGIWTANGKLMPHLNGCMDIDLGWTPSTNTLPIRRLALDGTTMKCPIDAARVRFPDLVLERLQQSYEALDRRTYRYTSNAGGFRAEITVDQSGIVDEYKGYWKRVL